MTSADVLTMFLCGDVMVGRGLDQILAYPSDPVLHERYIKNAIDYVKLAEARNGPIPRKVDSSYIWGEALSELSKEDPQVRIVNLETSITTSNHWADKGINYRMHPENSDVLTAAQIDICVLANNHILDWGEEGLIQTLQTLHGRGVKTAGAGRTREEAIAPAVVDLPSRGRVLVFSMATESSGVPPSWAAGKNKVGVNFIKDFSAATVQWLGQQIRSHRKERDLVIASIHWGDNWGYEVDEECSAFARSLVDVGVDVVHGHSSHHIKGLEVYREKLIIYGCGDFLNDYEGIRGFEEYHGEWPVMFFPKVDIPSGKLVSLRLVPLHLKQFQLSRATLAESTWIRDVLNREGQKWKTQFSVEIDRSVKMTW